MYFSLHWSLFLHYQFVTLQLLNLIQYCIAYSNFKFPFFIYFFFFLPKTYGARKCSEPGQNLIPRHTTEGHAASQGQSGNIDLKCLENGPRKSGTLPRNKWSQNTVVGVWHSIQEYPKKTGKSQEQTRAELHLNSVSDMTVIKE